MASSRLTRRRFLQTMATVVGVSLVTPVFNISFPIRADGTSAEGDYYEDFTIQSDEERLAYYEALGYVIEENGRKCVVNPLLPGQCMKYTKPYEKDRFMLLPPGATRDFYARCIRCGLCYYACTYMGYHAIRLLGVVNDLRRLGTPVVDDIMNYPCTLCMECTKVCPTGALEEVKPQEVRMGVALIDPDLCWAWNSGDCKSCAKACPFGSEVFEFTYNEWGVHTRVRPEKCTGCGLCVPACPIVGSAIHVLPIEEYERRTRNYKGLGISYDEYLQLILNTERSDPYKATWRTAINTDFIMNRRGIIEEKIVTELK